ncbi:hypothetical protein CYLTODRAFT_426280 [Cylindrobasidium torrendii FP15055 ss-10]|uniref:Shugoshin C-terminal domain-containing protein n=1 Tax=Cylindrobasidium torrendii FP15055 ss-10 TaxID=1314674 RepID=A0A0D7AZB9_9AGAR|nr:hypothetical protein CYLTODRAFT_426280 [Cylindrobasidium torrendii FP15055 ss-10]
MSTKRESRKSGGTAGTASDFETYKRACLKTNKQFAKLNSTLTSRINAMELEMLALYNENVRLSVRLVNEEGKTKRFFEDVESTFSNLRKTYLGSPKKTSPVPDTPRQTPSPPPTRRLSRPPAIPGIVEEDELTGFKENPLFKTLKTKPRIRTSKLPRSVLSSSTFTPIADHQLVDSPSPKDEVDEDIVLLGALDRKGEKGLKDMTNDPGSSRRTFLVPSPPPDDPPSSKEDAPRPKKKKSKTKTRSSDSDSSTAREGLSKPRARTDSGLDDGAVPNVVSEPLAGETPAPFEDPTPLSRAPVLDITEDVSCSASRPPERSVHQHQPDADISSSPSTSTSTTSRPQSAPARKALVPRRHLVDEESEDDGEADDEFVPGKFMYGAQRKRRRGAI